MDRFGDKICCNPTVKLKKQESYPVIDIDKITPGYKAVRSVASIEYTGQAIRDVRNARISVKDILAGAIDDCKKVPTPVKEIAKDRLFYRCANTMQ